MGAMRPDVAYQVSAFVTAGSNAKGAQGVEGCQENRMFTEHGENQPMSWYRQEGLQFDSPSEISDHEHEVVGLTIDTLAQHAEEQGMKVVQQGFGVIRFEDI